uniref:4-coumarate--CoA ligase n=1 Tax=Noccaea caerulescens TaxID=107243 RepID=A0A1J3F3W2_NOCCA
MAATDLHISHNAKTRTSHQKPPLWFSPETGIYTSKFPSLHLPVDPNLDAVSALFSHIHDGDDPASAAFVDSSTGFSISYTDLQIIVKSMAAGIYHDLGVRQGDVVSLMLPNSVYFPLIFLSLISLGAIVTTMNPSSSLGEIKKQASECNIGLAFTSPENVEKLSSLGIVVIRVPESYDFDSIRIENPKFYAIIKGDFGLVPKPLIKQDDVAAIMYSSGTTGVSKGVLLTHRNLIATMELFVRFEASQYEYPGSSNVYLAALPLCHIYGLSLFVMGLLSLGSTVVVMRRFDASDVIKVIERFKITHFPVVPPMLMALTKMAKGVCGQVFKSLKQVSSGAAPLSRKFIEDFLETLPHVDLIQGYGMTESTAVGTRGFNSEKLRKYSSVGLLAPNMQAKVVDWSSGSFLPPGNRGELWIQGPGVMKGYLNNPEATQMTLVEDSWLRTGDIAYFDEDGYLFIVDRIKEIIKYKGFQIAPADLEAVLVSHPLIIDAAVTAAPNEECGEIPVAFVVRRQETTLTEEDVISYVAAQVAPYRKVRKVVMVSSIPKSPTGKILRRELKRFLTNCVSSRL